MPEDDLPSYYHSKDWLIEQAKASGLSTEEIVLMITRAYQYKEAVRNAKSYAPLLGISYGDFMKIARRGPGKR
ncbi:MAG: hypothetical protein ABSG73_13455 [Candidatus Aminicenantales bacterium]|jgi:hypothetical protein